MMFLLLAQVASVAAPTADQAASRPSSPLSVSTAKDGTVVVSARRSADTDAALRRCLAVNCPPDQDIAATLAHAEAQFLEGRYPESRRTLLASRGRNKRYARQYPIPVSRLSNGLARLSSVLGWREHSRIMTIEGVEALRAGLPPDDPRILRQRLATGDAYISEGRLHAAEELYASVRNEARRRGAADVEGQALLKTALMFIAFSSVNPDYRFRAERAIAAVAETTDPQLASLREVTPYLRAQLAIRGDDPAAADAALAVLGKQKGGQPVLVYAPPLDLGLRGATRTNDHNLGTNANELLGTNAAIPVYDLREQWADVGFWVVPDGTVRDVEVLRSGKAVWSRWVKAVSANVARRRYQPLALANDDPGVFKVERYSMVSDIGTFKQSRLHGSIGTPHLEVVDLTVTMPKAAASAPATRVD